MTDNIKLPPMPKPDTHCFDEDRATDVWSHSPAQMQDYARAAVEADRAQRVLDAGGDLTIAYLYGFANGKKDAALTASTAHPSPAQAQQPVSGADELLALARAALEPFADLGAWLFARNLPDDTPMVDVVHINNVKTTLTRGHFKAAHSAATDIDAALDAAMKGE